MTEQFQPTTGERYYFVANVKGRSGLGGWFTHWREFYPNDAICKEHRRTGNMFATMEQSDAACEKQDPFTDVFKTEELSLFD